MTRSLLFLLPLLAGPLCAFPALAEDREAACRAQAERVSGYRLRAPEVDAGGVTLRLGGSVALGVSRSQGAPAPTAPPFAGAAHRERFEAERNRKRAEHYQRLFDDCMGAAQD
ncbi:hypothetical protein [Antarcticimicrobium luteum]|uniref:Uncharacterized protein n=1 Tax=Antarcticimicrobium luteum TaxID=2547397 RepID=A0A4R5V040_9RHOB|nr:hypothetical protein [Antarcticimicrobium luteum]TDK45049.1 hypothetical protein E1832_14335 [Antarcticimicrobium luteum]